MLRFTEHSPEYISIGKDNLKVGSIWLNAYGKWVLGDLFRPNLLVGADFRQIADKLDELNKS